MRVPSPRLLTLAAAAGSASASVAMIILGILDVLSFADAIQLSVVFAALGVLAAVLIGVRRVDTKVQRLIWSHREHAEGTRGKTEGKSPPAVDPELRTRLDDVLAALGEDRVMVLTHNGAVSDRLAEVEGRVTSMGSALAGEVAALGQGLDQLSGKVSAVPAGLDALSDRVQGLDRMSEVAYEQLETYVDLRGLIRARAPMPALRGWAASPDVVHLLAETMWERRPKLIVECGSGSSSVWLGYFAEQIGSARVVALEHDERFAAISRDLIHAHNLEDVVEIRSAPLADWEGPDRTYRWHDTEVLKDLTDIGLLFVDGPPGAIGPLARYPAMPLLLPRCGDDAVIVLDDSAREEETTISDRWMAEFPELERIVQRRFDKGAHVFFRRAS